MPAEPDAPDGDSVGARLRQFRRRGDVTLHQLAAAVGVSESFVSQVERGVANPSLATLTRMVGALGVTMAALFSGPDPTSSVIRAGERQRLERAGGLTENFLLTPPGARTMLVLYSVLGVGQGSGDEPCAHGADEECVIVLDGQLDVRVGGDDHRLLSGDSLLFNPKVQHSYRNPGPETATSLWVRSPPIF